MHKLMRLTFFCFCTLIAASVSFISQASANNTIITLSGDNLSGTIAYDTALGITAADIDLLPNLTNSLGFPLIPPEVGAYENFFDEIPPADIFPGDFTVYYVQGDVTIADEIFQIRFPRSKSFLDTFALEPRTLSNIDVSLRLNTFDKDTGNLTVSGPNILASVNFASAPVPEPSTYAMMALGLLGIAGMRRCQNQA